MARRNLTVDFAKYIASLSIIAIHTGLFADVHPELYFVVVQIISRMAVPFFAVCTGYFLASKLETDGVQTNSADVFVKYCKKIVLMYFVWTMLYLIYSLPTWISTGWFSAWAFVDYSIGACLNGSHYHLWYLLSLIYAVPCFYVCVRWIQSKHLIVVSAVLYAIKVLMYGYRNYTPALMQRLFALFDRFGGLTSGVFLVLPLLLLGAYICRSKYKNPKYNVYGFIISLILLMIEAVWLSWSGQTNVSFIVFTYPTAYFLFSIIKDAKINLSGKVCQILGGASLIIYCVHPMAIEILHPYLKGSVTLFIVVVLLSTAIGLIYVEVKNIWKAR